MLAFRIFFAISKFNLNIKQLVSDKHILRAFVGGFTRPKRRINDAIFMAACVPRFRYIRSINPYG